MASDLQPLKGARIWLSASVAPDADIAVSDNVLNFVRGFSASVFRAGGTIVHGSHPSIVPTLLEAAEKFQQAGGSRTCLMLVASRHFAAEYAAQLADWQSKSIVVEVPVADDGRAASLRQMRRWIADRCDAVVSFGGKWWMENPGVAGIPEEFGLAKERGLPCFLLAGLGGAAGGYFKAHPEVVRGLRNGLDEAANIELAEQQDVGRLIGEVVSQLGHLPLVRGEALGDATFRILSLDGGGIKGTFTAAVLKEWEASLGCKLTEHFDLIAGTSTGGILALGLGMGLSAADMLEFYEKRGPTVFPLTSVRSKVRHGLWQIIRPKFDQRALAAELKAAFAKSPGKVMHDSLCRLVIPALHARTGSVHIFRTDHHPNLITDRGKSATDIALATAAAPTYFRAAEVSDGAYVDGGMWANNPTLAALVEAVAWLNVPLNRIDILSIGTTSAPYSGNAAMNAGYLGWLKGGRIVELLMHAQAQGTVALAAGLAGSARILRVDEMLVPKEVSLDKIESIPALKDYGIRAASQPEVLAAVRARFLNGVRVLPW